MVCGALDCRHFEGTGPGNVEGANRIDSIEQAKKVDFYAGFIARVNVVGRVIVTAECLAESSHVRPRHVLTHLVVLVDFICKGDHFLVTHGEQADVGDHAGKEACSEGSTGEAEYVDSVSRCVVAHEEAVTGNYVRVEGGGEPSVNCLSDGALNSAEEGGVDRGAVTGVSSYTGLGGEMLAFGWGGFLGGRCWAIALERLTLVVVHLLAISSIKHFIKLDNVRIPSIPCKGVSSAIKT